MSLDILRALQLADSGFPSGSFAYSWGLETAAAHGHVTRATFDAWLAAEMLDRWAEFDRVLIADAHRSDDALIVDAGADRLFLAETLRVRSAEAGQAFLSATARLGDPEAARLRTATLRGDAAGHLPVVQGAVFRSMGLDLALTLIASAHAAAQGLASAAVRLGLIGALDAQRALRELHAELAPATVPPPPEMVPASFAPIAEIAMMRPAEGRLFAN
ncbi:MAG: urease accessory UreF family protein [Pseudomonadota bacterium]